MYKEKKKEEKKPQCQDTNISNQVKLMIPSKYVYSIL